MTWATKLQEHRERRAEERKRNLANLCTPNRGLHRGTYAANDSHAAAPKLLPVRSEAYRRTVAKLSCVHCGRLGCQCAHSNTGKGMGIKASDLDTFPLCPACHHAFDQGALFTKEQRREIEPQWVRATQAAVWDSGLWPKGIAVPEVSA